MGLENKVALVTGAASEMGSSFVKYLFQNRVQVLLCDINVEKCIIIAENLTKESRKNSVISVKCDVTKEDEFESAFKMCIKHFGRLDIVVNNAGVFDDSIDRWSTTVSVNYGGIVRGTLLAIKYMGIPNGGNGGTVIQTTSLMAFSNTFRNTPMFKSTKKYVIEFTKRFGRQRNFSLHGVKIITLCSGFTGSSCVRIINQNDTIHDNEENIEEVGHFSQHIIMQKPEHVGNALIEILEQGKNGEIWIVKDNKPPVLIEI